MTTSTGGYPAVSSYTAVFVGATVLAAAGVAAALAFPRTAGQPEAEAPISSGRVTRPIRPTT
ncbi:hypothetical protein [Streptomyces fulvorobeus]|uniref:hypothetical protein n=1 Tax=Streptomyces fulvorobeus TaxID=284028 RepID=UPI002114F77F|nr:hypothetical protein [Streptomyces fulvorobeus]